MNVLDAIKNRRSTRSFDKRRLSPEVFEAIEDAILYSPSGSNAQESHFVIVKDPVQIRRIKRFAQGLSGDPAAIVVLCTNKTEALIRGGIDTAEVLRFVNLGIAAANILVSAQSLDVASCPARSFHQKSIKEIIGLPEDVQPELLISLGYANQPPRPKTSKPAREVISYDRYVKETL
ncbi:nitroreductase family protein [Paenibacillus alginolyticus]|uniref:Nitroreductase family protein n=1 Tax=Paenibacillus alginolyticus TaxID=59839 RepID=A0ABT4GKB3_9BACL|nr:nitroreductase family protein [Paenibacillus alginolyticus]MCY9670182.1 nitroreductase family protein [Paenibacillus alginolyticus]MCY9696610.1 nitroreductase family protein [Paenibacillus alginolyticus]MEC0145221.1 nitroreductase family protein [Paenibacillus alginolyticus]